MKEINDEMPNLHSVYRPNVWVVTGYTHNEKIISSIFLGIGYIMNERMEVNSMDCSRMKTYIFYNP